MLGSPGAQCIRCPTRNPRDDISGPRTFDSWTASTRSPGGAVTIVVDAVRRADRGVAKVQPPIERQLVLVDSAIGHVKGAGGAQPQRQPVPRCSYGIDELLDPLAGQIGRIRDLGVTRPSCEGDMGKAVGA